MKKKGRRRKARPKPRPELNLWGEPLEDRQAAEPAPLDLNFEGSRVRIAMIKGEPWWVLSDVARVLGYRDAEKAKRLLRERHLTTPLKGSTELRSDMALVSEPGLYRLILRSDKPEAERFQDWLTDEVLPAIRRTGSYSIAQADPRISKTAKRLKCDAKTAERRVLQTDINKRTHERFASQGASVKDYAAYHNAGYSGLLGAEAPALRASLELKAGKTPLDRMSEIVLSQNYHAKLIAERVVAAASVPIPPSAQAEMLRITAQDLRESDLKRLGPDHTYGVVEDSARGKVLDIVRVQIPSRSD